MPEAKAKIIIEAEGDKAIKELQEIAKTMKGVKKGTGDASEAAKKQSKTLDGLKGNWKAMVAVVGSVTAAMYTAKKAFDWAKEGASLQRVADAGENLAAQYGTSMDAIVEAVDKAANGTVSRNDIILASNRAMLLGVADTAEEMAQLMDVARKRGAAMGLTTAQAFNDIVTGIGRASPLILDNLGIVTGGQKTYDDFAKSIDKTADSLTDAEKKQALFNKAIAGTQGMPAVEGAADSWESFDASLKDLTDTIKMGLVPALTPLVEFITDIADAQIKAMETTDTLTKAVEMGIITQEEFQIVIQKGEGVLAAGRDWHELYEEAVEGVKNMTEGVIPAMQEEADMLNALAQENAIAVPEVEKMTDATEKLSNAYMGAAKNIGKMKQSSLDYILWAETGGLEAMIEIESVMADYRTGLITAAQAVKRLQKAEQNRADAIASFPANVYGGHTMHQHGGRLGQVASVGEAGWEYVVNGVVIPHDESVKLKQLGVFGRPKHFQAGGPLMDGEWGGTSGTPTGTTKISEPVSYDWSYLPPAFQPSKATQTYVAPPSQQEAPPPPTDIAMVATVTDVASQTTSAQQQFTATISRQMEKQTDETRRQTSITENKLEDVVRELQGMRKELPRTVRDAVLLEIG